MCNETAEENCTELHNYAPKVIFCEKAEEQKGRLIVTLIIDYFTLVQTRQQCTEPAL